MADTSEIAAALVAKLRADATLTALVPDGVFRDEAGASMADGGSPKRFVIVSLVEGRDVAEFGRRAYESALYAIDARMLSTAGGNVKAAAARIDVLLENGTLTVAGYGLMAMYREEPIGFIEVDELDNSIRWLRRGGRYRVEMAVV